MPFLVAMKSSRPPPQLPAEPSHVDGEGVLIHVGVGLPQALHEGFPAHDFPLLLQKGLENAAFIFGQGQPPAPVQKGGCRRIQNGSRYSRAGSGAPKS